MLTHDLATVYDLLFEEKVFSIMSKNGTIMALCIMYLDTYQIAAADVKLIMALLSKNSVAFSSGKGERAKRERV